MDKEKLLESGFTLDQVNEIQEGLDEGLDISVYAKKEFLAIQMRQIRLGMHEGLPVEVYTRPEYDWFQMEEIRKGLQAGVDIKQYASPNISYDRMRQIRKGLVKNINLAPYVKLDAGILRQLRKALLAKVNIIGYIKQGYETEQLEQIRKALQKEIDVSPYLQKEFQGASIREIRKGLECGLDVASYAKIDYSWQQMREIRFGLANRVDTSQYISSFYSWEQMREIRLGLEEGLDVSVYRSLMYTAKEMRKYRISLQEKDVSERPKKAVSEEKFEHFSISVSQDEMEAWVEVNGNVTELDRESIVSALDKSGVRQGIQEDVIGILTSGKHFSKPMLIAKGYDAKDGQDGWYEYFFRTEFDKKPKLLPDGSVDYQNIDWFEMVTEGQKIAYYHAAEQGINGMTVTGRIIRAKKGHEKRALAGKGFQLLPDQKTYLAAVNGRIELKKNRIEITRMLLIDEMTQASGRVDFDGSVYVRGHIGSGAYLRATADIVVDGFVESAMIESGGSIVLRQGVNASGNGFIKAGKSVVGKFFEAVKVHAKEDIHANYCLNCDLFAKGRIKISGTKGALAGGSICAVNGLKAHNVGNRAGIATLIKLGRNDSILEEQKVLEDKIKEVHKELNMLGNGYLDMQRKYPPEVRNTMVTYIKLECAIMTKEKQMEKLMENQKEMEEKIRQIEQARAVVEGRVHEGVSVEINGLRWLASEIKNVTIKKVGNRIAVYSNY